MPVQWANARARPQPEPCPAQGGRYRRAATEPGVLDPFGIVGWLAVGAGSSSHI